MNCLYFSRNVCIPTLRVVSQGWKYTFTGFPPFMAPDPSYHGGYHPADHGSGPEPSLVAPFFFFFSILNSNTSTVCFDYIFRSISKDYYCLCHTWLVSWHQTQNSIWSYWLCNRLSHHFFLLLSGTAIAPGSS